MRFAAAFIMLIVIYFSIRSSESDAYTRLLVIIVAAGLLLQAFEVIDFYFQSQVWGKFLGIIGIGGMILSSILKIILVWNEAPLVWFAITVLVQGVFKGLMLIFLYSKKNLSLFKWRFRWSRAQDLLKDSWPLIFSGLALMVYMRIDQVMIKMMLGSHAVGNYSVAVRLSEAWYFVPIVIARSVFPAIVNAREKDNNLYKQRLQRFYSLMTWMGIGVAIPTTFFYSWIVQILFGIDYSDAAPVLAIHIWAGVFVFMGVASTKYLIAENLQKFTFILRFCGCISNVLLNFALIPRYGIVGAATATVITQFLASYLGYLFSKKTHLNFIYLTNSLFYPFKIVFRKFSFERP
jgi:O-antigen/teichoic acid export membrane protein